VDRPVKEYSKGMQQRLGLAQALLNDPQVLFLDEPTDGLDPLGRKDVRNLIVALRDRGKTIFLNSHLLSEIELICDHIVVLNRGLVARTATPAEFTRGTGEVVVRLAEVSDAVRAAVADMPCTWQGTTLRFIACDRAHLNLLLDRLRAVPVEIEAVEPVKLSLEQFFMEAVS
jgi:ABC-2 type transport system ATP-binding protein